jgi:uncharacterized BrkB/YihY/UPF0761 family membrane protein
MADPDEPQQREQIPTEMNVEPTPLGRFAIWVQRTHLLRTKVEGARRRHSSVDLGFAVVERDAAIGGGLLAGALAYRLFVLLLPVALLCVSGIGLYAGAADRSPGKVAHEAGLHGLIASQVASTASSGARWLVFLVMVPAILYALAKLYRAIAITHAIAWHGSGRGTRLTRRGIGALGAALLADLVAAVIVGWIRRQSGVGGLYALLVYMVLVGGTWLVVSMELPRRETRWFDLLPGAVLFGAGLLLVNVFNVYVTTRLVEDRANTYGVLGVSAALLFSLVLVGRLIVVSAELNAALDERRGSRLRS